MSTAHLEDASRRPGRVRRAVAAAFVISLIGGTLAWPRQVATGSSPPAPQFRSHTDTYPAPQIASAAAWKARASYLREHVLASAGLLPMPERTPLRPQVFGEVTHRDYSVSKVYFESLPGFLVTGNLYRPVGSGPFPAVLSPHGHWPYGRLENTPVVSGPGRAIGLARQGFVVFSYDMVGYTDSRQLPHTFGGRREALWGLSLAGLQLWNSIRALDFLEALPEVRRDAIGMTGESGGGTQTFLLAVVDDRVRVAAPVNMISLHMQGGCLCENPPGLRLDTTNVEIAAAIAPRPLLMVSATGDWTSNTLEKEFPAVRAVYDLVGSAGRVQAVRVDAEHNYNRESRQAMYAWMARWLQGAPESAAANPERSFTVDSPADLLVFHQRALPAGLLTPSELTASWVEAARRQLATVPSAVALRALHHALGYGDAPPVSAPARPADRKLVLLASEDVVLSAALRQAGYKVQTVSFTPFDTAAAAKILHFDTYNRTQAATRVADIVAAMRAHPGAALIAAGDAALAGLLAASVVPIGVAVLDVDRFDTSSDAALLEHLYIPGLQRAGGLQTAATAAGKRVIVHDAGTAFQVTGIEVRQTPLTPAAIVDLLRARAR